MEQQGLLMELFSLLAQTAIDTFDDVLPVAAIIVGFQVLILRQRIPNLKSVLIGFIYVLIGLTLFLVGLEEERFRYLGDFSTGMQQRVKLAQAIVHDPDLLLLDEPASGLDPEGRVQMLQLIKRLGDFDISVIISSHVLTDIEETCDWVVMLDAGDLLRSGPLEGFEQGGTVLVEVLEKADEVAGRLIADGFNANVDGALIMVGPGDETIERSIVEAVVAADSGLVRMTRGSASLEDLFLGEGT